ncbi:hypothetical protein BGX27_011007 [Mortierella sp. AM989]|nr:hypothetical protein BGX27_011007 [Mortierella sp. AM989]
MNILYFGGYNISMKSNRQDNVVSEYIPSTGIWQTLLTSGPSPAMRADHCMTANDDGSLIVIYGGSLAGSTFLNDIYILNTISQTWSMGTAGMTRAYATCTIAGDQLLVWGGLDGYKELANTDVQIYNIHKNAWVTTYIPPASYIDTNPTQRTPSSPLPSDESSNAASIAGGIAGGLVVIAGVILLFIFLRRKRGGQYELSLINTKYEEDYDSTPARQQTSRNEEEELRDLRAHILTQQEELDMQRRVLIAQQEQNQEHHRQQIQLFQQQQEQQPRECYQAGYPYQPPITHGAGVATPEPLVFEY